MDSKFSDFPKAQSIGVTDFFPIVKDGDNQTITAGALFLNLPNLGNKGITKNAVVVASSASVPLTATLVVLPALQGFYTVPNGSEGQEITLLSADINSLYFSSAFNANVQMGVGSSLTVVFTSSIGKWIPKSHHNCIFG